MNCTTTSWPSMLEEHCACAPPLPQADCNHAQKAKKDIFRLRRHLMKAGKRKTCPIHFSPTSVLLMMLCPNWRLSQSKQWKLRGLGSLAVGITVCRRTPLRLVLLAPTHARLCRAWRSPPGRSVWLQDATLRAQSEANEFTVLRAQHNSPAS